MDKIKISSAVIVEGKYDKIKLDSILDAEIIETNGFSIFKDKALQNYIKKLSDERGIITATDSDGGGLTIRNFLSGIVPPEKIRHVYIPKQYGKEPRKDSPSKEGTVGVEGISADLLRNLFLPFSVDESPICSEEVTALDFYEDGLAGTPGSAEKRKKLCLALGVPDNISTKALIKSINLSGGYRIYKNALDSISEADNERR